MLLVLAGVIVGGCVLLVLAGVIVGGRALLVVARVIVGGRARTSPTLAVKDASHRFAAAFGRP